MKRWEDTTAREMLEILNHWAEKAQYEEVRSLWFVLSALRGPDEDMEYVDGVKRNTTEIIRYVAFPKFVTAVFMDWHKDTLANVRSNVSQSGHFRTHVELATAHLKKMGYK